MLRCKALRASNCVDATVLAAQRPRHLAAPNRGHAGTREEEPGHFARLKQRKKTIPFNVMLVKGHEQYRTFCGEVNFRRSECK